MNILFIESSIPPNNGGVERVSWLLGNYLKKNHNDVYFAYCHLDSDLVDENHKMSYSFSDNEKKLCAKFRSFLNIKSIDVIILQGIFNYRLIKVLGILKSELKCNLLGCFHLSPGYLRYANVSLKSTLKYLIYNLILRRNNIRTFYKLSDGLVLLSATFVDQMVSEYNLPDKYKLYSIPNPLSYNIRLGGDKIQSKKNNVLIVSRLDNAQKNLTAALRIWKKIEEKGHKDWILIMAGAGDDENLILDYAKSLKLNQFKFVGRVDKPETLYEKSSIFMMTSNYEGFGMTLTESLQYGCVPIAFDTYSALHDILLDGYNGYIIPEKDEKRYVEKLEYLIMNKCNRNEMAHNGIKSVEKFSIDVVGQKWLNLFKKIRYEGQ